MTGADLPLWATIPAALLLAMGGLLTLIASAGLLRLPTFFARMHAPTLSSTLGTGCVLIASMLVSSAQASRPMLHELLITGFIAMTSPMTAILLMRAAIRRSGERIT